jgi:serine/threonine-protein phosphatase 2A regulatory subunit A
MDPRPMDIDPVDDGPKEPVKMHAMTGVAPASSSGAAPMQVSEEEEARQAIEMLRGDDVSARVAAASKLGAVASVLGEERTREVGFNSKLSPLVSGLESQRYCLLIFLLCMSYL